MCGFFSERDRRIGTLKCRICSTGHSSKVHHLSAAVDVYCDWIDECHKVNSIENQLTGGVKRQRASVAEDSDDDAFR